MDYGHTANQAPVTPSDDRETKEHSYAEQPVISSETYPDFAPKEPEALGEIVDAPTGIPVPEAPQPTVPAATDAVATNFANDVPVTDPFTTAREITAHTNLGSAYEQMTRGRGTA